MDSLTHIYFAHKLLSMTGGDPAAAVCSLFPQIDREPAYYHRMYAHPFFQISKLSEIGTYVYKHTAVKDGNDSYAWRRFYADLSRMRSFVQTFEQETQLNISNFNPDRLSVLIAYVSHTYQDIFNNPMQGFLPHWVYPSGQWKLWSELGAIDFRTALYTPENISAFREEFFASPLWKVTLDGTALIKAMINRTAAASALEIPLKIVDNAFDSLELDLPVDNSEVKAAEQLLIEHEELLSNMMRKYSQPPLSPHQYPAIPVRS